MPPQQRPIKRLLVVNRGEIAIRILQACHELPSPPTTFALYTDVDTTHITLGRPHHAIKVVSPATYTDINSIIKIAIENKIDAVHPGYGFLSESAEFSRRMWEEANVLVVGPGWEVLERTGDKLKAKALAEEGGVPVLKAMRNPSSSVEDVRMFARSIGFPIMVKAVDGGGGRGIRLVENEVSLQNAVERCIGESPSKTVFAEQAAIRGFKHIEVQIIGDGKGGVKHLWERDCSVQRRFQKIVEVAPTPTKDRRTVGKVVESAMSMGNRLKYLGLGTFEYLVNVKSGEFFFLEINPRVQVEHTISETVRGVDLVREQLLIAQGQNALENHRFGDISQARDHPQAYSIQLRLCAEDPNSNFALSIGRVAEVVIPSGNGVRVDSHLSKGGSVGSDFDNMMAKIIVTASTWEQTLAKARRALAETRVSGVKTNLDLLRAIVGDEAFCAGHADTTWLESNMQKLIEQGQKLGSKTESATANLPVFPASSTQSQGLASSNISFRKGDAWTLHLEGGEGLSKEGHHLSLDRIIRNEFPDAIVADISFTAPGQKPLTFKATVASTTTSAGATASTHRRGDCNNKNHVVVPMSGKLIEVLVDEGDEIKENDIIAFVKQMKMELEIRSPRSGIVDWVIELESEEGDDVAEGVLLVELKPEESSKPDIRSKL
ncbi:hypothetical protein H2198_004738 [Neophaeococcomyces mojaviensis]|uniref:Uncharacterized protein n=1 Tax=Neophaeococcomyces mojaviensis TaxID=3383035 RepID=A0ACC3A7N1_9EURO|nr:hypothetical protein H2198_004738 [Knufia sp. JES_112]